MDTFITQRSATEFRCTDVEALMDWLKRRGWQLKATERLGELERLEFDGALIVVSVAVVKCAGPNWQYASDVLSELARPIGEREAQSLARAYQRIATYAEQHKAIAPVQMRLPLESEAA